MARLTATRLALAALLSMTMLLGHGCNQSGSGVEHVEVGARTWDLELATDDASIRQGLMNRSVIPDGTGMLFVFERPSVHSFWMGNCLIDIDLIFLDGTGRIVALHQMLAESPRGNDETEFAYQQRMPHYSSMVPVQFAIELPTGSIKRLGLKTGQIVPLDIARLRSMARP